jgi:hypothetical protein
VLAGVWRKSGRRRFAAVSDEGGAAVPGVTITATHIETGTSRTAVSTSTGAFLMPALPVGRYRQAPK